MVLSSRRLYSQNVQWFWPAGGCTVRTSNGSEQQEAVQSERPMVLTSRRLCSQTSNGSDQQEAVQWERLQTVNDLHLFQKKKQRRFLSLSVYLLLPLALQPTVGFGLSNNALPFFPICHQLSPSSHSQNLKISFYFLFPSFPGSSPSSRPFQFLSEDLFGYPILLHSLQVT